MSPVVKEETRKSRLSWRFANCSSPLYSMTLFISLSYMAVYTRVAPIRWADKFSLPDDPSSLQECREEQTLKSFGRDRGALRLGLKDGALQCRDQEAGELIAVVLA
jgi:hypothetical protein